MTVGHTPTQQVALLLVLTVDVAFLTRHTTKCKKVRKLCTISSVLISLTYYVRGCNIGILLDVKMLYRCSPNLSAALHQVGWQTGRDSQIRDPYLWRWVLPRPPAFPPGSLPRRWTCPRRWRRPSSISARSHPCRTWSRTCVGGGKKDKNRQQLSGSFEGRPHPGESQEQWATFQYFKRAGASGEKKKPAKVYFSLETHGEVYCSFWQMETALRGGSIIQQWHTAHREKCIQLEPTKLVQYSWDVSLRSGNKCV